MQMLIEKLYSEFEKQLMFQVIKMSFYVRLHRIPKAFCSKGQLALSQLALSHYSTVLEY